RRASFLKRWKDRDTGMWCGRFALDPIRGDAVFKALDAELDRLLAERPRPDVRPTEAELDQLGAEALHRLVTTSSGDSTGRAGIHVVIDYQTLLGDLHCHGICELADSSPIPAASARRLACQASIIPVVVGADGQALDVGRQHRLATAAQRQALRAMY